MENRPVRTIALLALVGIMPAWALTQEPPASAPPHVIDLRAPHDIKADQPEPMVAPEKPEIPAAEPGKGKPKSVVINASDLKVFGFKAPQTVVVVDREQLRVKHRVHTLSVPNHLKGVIASLPPVPATFDWTKGNTIPFPMDGNDQVGNCYYVAMDKIIRTLRGMRGADVSFDVNKLIARYRKLSGGDNGLSDYDVFGQNHNGEFYGGIVGPNGPYKILDHLMVKPTDAAGIAAAQYYFGATIYTAALCDEWLNNARPGALWDRGRSNPNAGHAIILNGRNDKGNWKLQTWGLNPPIELTQAGLESADPEVIVCFSLEWFDPKTGLAPNGMHYVDLASLWVTLGGRALPPNPFPAPGPTPNPPVPPTPPAPPTPPTPPAPGSAFTGVLVYKDGVLIQVIPGATPGGATVEADLRAAGVDLAVIMDVLQLIADVRAGKPIGVIMTDLLKIIADLNAANEQKKKLEDGKPNGRADADAWALAA